MYWDVDALFPPVFDCYGVSLMQRKLLPLTIEPAIADLRRKQAETALTCLDKHLSDGAYLCGAYPTVADIFCYGDVAFAQVCEFDLTRWPNSSSWARKMTALPGFKAPFDLLQMQDAVFP